MECVVQDELCWDIIDLSGLVLYEDLFPNRPAQKCVVDAV